MEIHAIGYRVQRVVVARNHKSGMSFTVDTDADGPGDTYACRLTQRRTLACVNGAHGEELKRMKVPQSRLFSGLEP